MVMYSPRFTGRAGRPGILPTGAASSPELAITIAPCVASPILKMPGPKGARATFTGLLVTPSTVTERDACDWPESSHGTWKLACPGNALNTNAGRPSNCIETAAAGDGATKPKAVAMLPGARGTPPPNV